MFNDTITPKWYHDLNSVQLMWARWALFVNQSAWIACSLFTTNQTLIVTSYCLSVLPSLLFITLENLVLCIQPFRSFEELHKSSWTIYRVLSVATASILLCVWIGTREVGLVVIAWYIIAGVLLFESTISCIAYERCCLPFRCCNSGYQVI